jgi:hypothetical protein
LLHEHPDPGEHARLVALVLRLRQPGDEEEPDDTGGEDRSRERQPPEVEVSRYPSGHGGERGGERTRRYLVGERPPTRPERDRVPYVH